MKTKHKSFLRLVFAVVILFINLGSMPKIVEAAPGDGVIDIDITVKYGIDCGEVTFDISLDDITSPYELVIDYGDGITSESMKFTSGEVPTGLTHTYFSNGVYDLTITVTESGEGGLTGTTSSVITIGPTVDLSSEPFPPLVGPGDTVTFLTKVTGGTPGLSGYQYAWDLDGVKGYDSGTTGDSASFTYEETGKYQAQVEVTDGCGFKSTDTLPVVVADSGDICHPTAQKIADAVNTIFPDQAGDLYTCEEIYDIFDGLTDDSQVGFGRMWKAYNLALTMEKLTWEEIRDWHLDVGGWGALLQLDRFSELLETHGLPELMGLVMSEEYSLGDVRTAVRSTTHYEADFEDALARIAGGATAGELGQFYKLAADLEVDPAALDVYLAGEFTLSQLKHTANVADRMEVDWTEIAAAGGVQDYMKDLREVEQEERAEQQAIQQEERLEQKATQQEERVEQKATQQKDKNQQTAKKLAEQFNVDHGLVEGMFGEGGICEGDWGCVRNALREQEQEITQADGVLSERDTQTASQIASKYDSTPEEVLEYHNIFCGGDWACTRAYFRELSTSTKETGKPDK